MTLAVTVDKRWAGFYWQKGEISTRLCLGWLAIDYFYGSLDILLHACSEFIVKHSPEMK